MYCFRFVETVGSLFVESRFLDVLNVQMQENPYVILYQVMEPNDYLIKTLKQKCSFMNRGHILKKLFVSSRIFIIFLRYSSDMVN